MVDTNASFFAYGEMVKGGGRLPLPFTLFEIGSISKTFTSTLLALAVVEGRLRLDDTVNKYLPDSIPLLQYEGRVMTPKDLANHTSGLPRMPSNFFAPVLDLQDPYHTYTVDKLMSFLVHTRLSRAPGSLYEYSNVGVGLLGVILQRVYGLPYEEMVLRYICRPLDMNDTRVTIRKEDSAMFAAGYDPNGTYTAHWNLPAAFAGAGAIRSTGRDLIYYAQAHVHGAPGALGKAILLTHDTTFSQNGTTLGLGWHYILPGEGKILFHNGGTGGFRSYLAIDPVKKLAVVILANSAISVDGAGNELMRFLEKKKG
jgi:CubicO group peptidase (beta-lactamase class C family)